MQGRIRHYRVRLIAYDALLLHSFCLQGRIPSPSPTPFAPLVPSRLSARSLPYVQQRRLLRKVRLTHERSKIADV